MHISGSCGEGGGKGGEGMEDNVTPFLTPQHLARTPAQSYFSILNSEDSLEVYHDAHTTPQRPLHNFVDKTERKRHASVGTATRENGLAVEMNLVDSTKTKGLLPAQSGMVASGRVRHASCNTASLANASLHNALGNPYHIGRLSLSTNSLKKKTDRDQPSKKIGSLQKIGEKGNYNWAPNMAYVEMNVCESGSKARVQDAASSLIVKDTPEKFSDRDSAAWKRNYVQCVGVDRLLGRIDEGDGLHLQQEIHLHPEHVEQPKDTVEKMYTFGPVERRRLALQRLQEEFRPENLRLHHKTPHFFVSSQWQDHNMSCLYLGYRIFWALYFSMWAVWAWAGSMGYDADFSVKGYFVLYMTNWGIWTLAVDTTIQAINVVLHCKKISEEDEKLNEIGVNTHIMPGLYILLDVAVSATPRRLLHAYQPSVFIFVYTFFNLAYYLCGGLDVKGRSALYPVIDWTRPGRTVGIMSSVILGLVPLLHAVLCALYAGRLKVWRSLKTSRYVREEDEMDQVEGSAQEQKV
nr:uncharacterized protein LOC128690076 isoform X3 [Cherax quadricarinatus]